MNTKQITLNFQLMLSALYVSPMLFPMLLPLHHYLSPVVCDKRQWTIEFQLHLNPMTIVNKTNYNKLRSTRKHKWRYQQWKESDAKVFGQRDQYDSVPKSNKVTHIKNCYPFLTTLNIQARYLQQNPNFRHHVIKYLIIQLMVFINFTIDLRPNQRP